MRPRNPVGWVASAFLVLGGVLLPSSMRTVAGFLTACGCVAVMVLIPVRRLPRAEVRPWQLFAAAGGLVLIGQLGTLWDGSAGEGSRGASWTDVVVLAGYCLLVAGEVSLARLRQAGAEGDHVLDALLVGVTATAVLAAFFVLPVLQEDQPAGARAVLVAFTVVEVALVAGAARLALGEGAKTRSWYLLVGGWISLIVVDLWPTERPPILVAYLPFVLVAAAAAHPSMRVLTEGAAPREAQLSGRRLVLLCVAMLLPPGLLVVALLSDRNDAVGLLAGVSTANAVLVLARLGVLVRSKERAVGREAALRSVAAGLLTATDASQIRQLATTAAGELAGPSGSARLLEADEVAPMSSGDEHITVLELRSPTRLLGFLAVASPRPPSPGARSALDLLADQVSLALVGVELRDEVHRRRTERRFRAFIDHSSDLVAVTGPDGLITFASPASERLLGVSAEFLVGTAPARIVHEDDRGLASGLAEACAAGELAEPVEVRLLRSDGSWRWFEVAASAFDTDGVGGLVLNMRDVEDRKCAERTLAEREARFSALVRYATDLVLVLASDGRIRWASPSSQRVLGMTDSQLAELSLAELIHPDDQIAAAGLVSSPDDRLVELRLRHATAGWRVIALTTTDLTELPAVGGIVVNARDVTEAKYLEDQLLHRALHDGLTGLPNRTHFTEQVERALVRAAHADGHVVVLFVDLDDFKTVNDGLGHTAGDLVLNVAGHRVAEATGSDGTAARLGGDEFAVLVEGPDAPRLAGQVGLRLVAQLSRPMSTERGMEVRLGASVGIADNATAGHTAGELLRGADVAMYLAKSRGKSRVEWYVQGMNAAVFERLEMRQDLTAAVGDLTQMEVVYQPLVDLASGRTTGVEALLRWDHPTRGAIPPAAFIPLAEDSGLIHPLGLYVLHEACRRLRRWTDAGHRLDVHVNVSARQLDDDAFVSRFGQTIMRYGLAPSSIVLELTEGLLASLDQRSTLERLHRLGVRIAIDDFGTGYASWSYLADLPVDILKLDRSFVSCLGSEHTRDVVRAIMEVARSHDIDVVAEGIEQTEERDILAALGCQQGQGWLFSSPLTAAQLEDRLDATATPPKEIRAKSG